MSAKRLACLLQSTLLLLLAAPLACDAPAAQPAASSPAQPAAAEPALPAVINDVPPTIADAPAAASASASAPSASLAIPLSEGSISAAASASAAAHAAAPTSGTAAIAGDPFADFVGKSVSHGLRTKKRIALTFDDGPHPTLTPQYIEILKKENVPATFFELGMMIKQYPTTAKLVHDSGFEIGDHSVTHADLSKADAAKVWTEIDDTKKLVESATGVAPRLFRPPYGAMNKIVRDAAQKDGMVLVLWGIDTNDWKADTTSEKVLATIKAEAKNGDIILMHDIHNKSLKVLPDIIHALKDAGFELVTVGQLLRDEAAATPEERALTTAGAAKAAAGGAEKSGQTAKGRAAVNSAPAEPLALPLGDISKY